MKKMYDKSQNGNTGERPLACARVECFNALPEKDYTDLDGKLYCGEGCQDIAKYPRRAANRLAAAAMTPSAGTMKGVSLRG